jgi:hypothetical protein
MSKVIIGRFEFLVEAEKSLKRPEGDTRVIKTEHGLLFPEDIQLYNHKDEWLYAFGLTHVWRSADAEEWELVK